jgi:hypothetical protein
MSRTIVTIAAAAMMSAALLLSPITASARRCEDKPPETLLSLYRKSAEIHIGRYERTEDFAVIEQAEDYTVVQVRKHFSISETLKGSSRTSFFTQEDEYRYSDSNYDGDEYADEHGYSMVKLEAGDAVMLFTAADPESGNLILADYVDGVKKLSADEMKSYTARVEELGSLFRSGEPTEAEALKWIMKAIEDPITRWEGAYELLSGVQYLEWKKEREEYLAEKTAKGETIEEWEYDLNYFDGGFDNSGYAKLLSEGDRRRLVDLLIESKPIERTKDNEYSLLVRGQDALTDLVGRWADRRVAAYLLAEIRRGGAHYYRTGQLMDVVATALGDSTLKSLGEKYSEIYYDDEEPIAEDSHVQIPVDPATGRPIKASNYGQVRAWVMARFTEKSEVLLTTAAGEQPSN